MVRQGASKLEALFLPIIPPTTVSGNPINTQTQIIRKIVEKGRA